MWMFFQYFVDTDKWRSVYRPRSTPPRKALAIRWSRILVGASQSGFCMRVYMQYIRESYALCIAMDPESAYACRGLH